VVHYYNLTAMGVTHSGNTGVPEWYRNFIVPTLGDQAPLVQQLQLNGQIDGAATGTSASAARADRAGIPTQVVSTGQPIFSGTAAPDSEVRLLLSPADKPAAIGLAGVTHADASGDWSLTTRRPLPDGQYRTVVTAFSRPLATRPGLEIVPTQPLGRLVVQQ
jgi:Bacterial Ig-like domain